MLLGRSPIRAQEQRGAESGRCWRGGAGMDIQDMRIFARVAAVQNLSAVGTELGLTPGTISKRIQSLEDELSARLFDRTTRSIRITEEGTAFLAHVERILSEIEAARASVDDKVSKPKGKLKIAAPACLGRRYVAPALCEFVRAFPEIDVQVDLHDRQVNLQEDGYDMAIRTGALSDSSLIAKRLAPDRHVIAASTAYLARAGRPLRAGRSGPPSMPGAGREPAVVVRQGRRRERGAGQRRAQIQQRRAALPRRRGRARPDPRLRARGAVRVALGQARAGAGRLRGRHQRGAVGAVSELPSTCCRACARCWTSWPTGSATPRTAPAIPASAALPWSPKARPAPPAPRFSCARGEAQAGSVGAGRSCQLVEHALDRGDLRGIARQIAVARVAPPVPAAIIVRGGSRPAETARLGHCRRPTRQSRSP